MKKIMSTAPLITIGILNWNGSHLLRKFLPDVVRCTPSDKACIVVIDNGSTDDSIEVVEREFPSVKLLKFSENYGFAKGYNQALAQCETPYYCLLNSDVAVTEGWLDAPLAMLEANARLAAVQPKIRSFHHPSQFEYAGAAGGFIDHLGYPFCRGRVFDTIEEDKGQYDTEASIFWASGACLFIRRHAYLQVGGLDERFFAHMEEIDLCWRWLRSGYEVRYTPNSTIYHLGGATLSTSNARKVYLNFRNNLLMLYKNLPRAHAKKLLPKRMLLDGLSAGMYLVKGKSRFAWAIYKAHRDFRKMKQHYTPPLAPPVQLSSVYPHSIVWQYFFLGKRHFSDLKP